MLSSLSLNINAFKELKNKRHKAIFDEAIADNEGEETDGKTGPPYSLLPQTDASSVMRLSETTAEQKYFGIGVRLR